MSALIGLQVGPNPFATTFRFGVTPQGHGHGPTGTDYRHPPYVLMALPLAMLRFGFGPIDNPFPPVGEGNAEWLIIARRRHTR